MAFMVPENFLENYKCSECFKFLSVMPIKIYQNQKIKCGRCTTNIDDDGINSLLQNFAELALFKCINRFDGCRTILTSNQVKNHEKECLNKEQLCPICVESTNLPTYQILQHFKQHHKENVLENYYFLLDIEEEALDTKKVLLYKIKDYLFFIYIKSVPDSISIQIELLGEHLMTDIVLNFYICDENCDVKSSIHHGSENGRVFVFSKSTFENNLLSVFFDLKEEAVAGKIMVVNHQNTNYTESAYLSLQSKIVIGKELEKLHPRISLSNRELGTEKVIPFCYVCSELFLGTKLESYNQNTQWCLENEKFQYVCLNCVYYYKYVLKKNVTGFIPLSFNMYNSIKYFCTLNCNSLLTSTQLLVHELFCSQQPLQECPFNCCEFKGNIIVIKYHLEVVHKTSLTFESCVENIENIQNDIYLYIKSYFVKVSNNNYGSYIKTNNFNINFCKREPKHLKLMYYFFFRESGNTYLMSSVSQFNNVSNLNLWCKIFLTKK